VSINPLELVTPPAARTSLSRCDQIKSLNSTRVAWSLGANIGVDTYPLACTIIKILAS